MHEYSLWVMCYHHFIWELYEVTIYILCELLIAV